MQTHTYSTSGTFPAIGTGIILLVVFAVVLNSGWISYDRMREAFIVATLLTIALLALVVRFFFTTREYTHQVAQSIAKEMFTHSQELSTEMYRNSPVPYIIIDERGNIESANLAAVRLFNVTLDALNGLDLFHFIESENERTMELIPEYYKKGRVVNDVEVHVRRPDGVSRWATLSLFPFKDNHRQRKGLLTLVDITKQKMVDKAKTEFVSLASHQLRTPISAMRWNIELLMTATGAELTETQRSYVEKVSGGLKRMDALVEDFLSASKLELGTLVAQKKEFDLAEFFASVLEEYTVTAEKRNIRIVTNWNTVQGMYLSDAHLLNMAVSNILGNAIKYTKEGGEVRAIAEYTEKGFIIQISDTGIGIPEDEQDMIFSKLFRASNAQTKETDGTGLGLYIVREAIRILGGNVTFTSQTGVGTTFTIALPAV